MESCLNLRLGLRFDPRKKISASAFASRLLLMLTALTCLGSAAAAQNFTLQISGSGFSPPAINPGGNSSAQLVIGETGNFSDTVDLSCEVSPAPPNGNAGCQVSPTSVTPPTGASVTVTTAGWDPAGYTITITGTSASTGSQTVSSRVTVLSVTSSFTVTVGTAVAPTSVPAGSSANATININPINGYQSQNGVTLACSSVTPLVIAPPVCSFYPASVNVSGSTTVTSQLTISTTGPLTITQAQRPRAWYAIFLPFPLALVGIGAMARGKKTRVGGLLALLLCFSTFLLMPACGTNSTLSTTTPSQLITPNGTYTFTITAVDNTTGAGASNSTNGTTDTVTLTVTSATAQ
jgi:hypothetical protein